MNEQEIKRFVSEQMRKVALAKTAEQRQESGRKAWRTRIANLAAKMISPGMKLGE